MALNTDSQGTIKWLQSSFEGGMRRNIDPTKFGQNEYVLLINGRNRYGSIKPVKNPLQITSNLIEGNFQGIYSLGSILMCFINGKIFYKDYETSIDFGQIGGLQLDPTVNFIYTENVPESLANFKRTAPDGVKGDLVLTSSTDHSPRCMICQDGINRPKIVSPELVVRDAKTFDDWTQEDREYVPVGLNMLYCDGILYVVSPDQNNLYHSVSGRPLDFVIAIDSNGDKLTDGLFTEEADRTAHRVTFDKITAISNLNNQPINPNFGCSMLISTINSSYRVTPNYTNLQYGEPLFSNVWLFTTGALDQFSVAYIGGDFGIVDYTGVRSFNSVSQTEVESKDIALTGKIYRIFEGPNGQSIIQDITCITFFDNYAYIGVKTIYGYGILIYDYLLSQTLDDDIFAGIDIYDGVDAVKQFAQIKLSDGTRKIFFITRDNKLYEMFGSSITATCKFMSREFAPEDLEVDQKPTRVRLTFRDIIENGIVSATAYVERKAGDTLVSTITANLINLSVPISPPLGENSRSTSKNKTFSPQNEQQGDTVAYYIEFNFIADLVGIQIIAEPDLNKVSFDEQAEAYAS